MQGRKEDGIIEMCNHELYPGFSVSSNIHNILTPGSENEKRLQVTDEANKDFSDEGTEELWSQQGL